MAREHKILHVDEIKRSFNNKRKSVPIAGYYKDIILKLADSEEELLNLMSQERTRRLAETTIIETNDKNTTKRSSNTRKEEQAQKERARVANLRQLNSSSEDEEKKKNDIETVMIFRDHISFTDYMEVVEKNKAMEAELVELRTTSILQANEIQILKDQFREVADKNKELVRLNIQYQQSILMDSRKLKDNKCKSMSVKRKISFEGNDLNENCTIPKLNHQIDVKDDSKASEDVPVAEPSESENPSVDGEDELGFTLTDAQFKAANQVASGITGDSKFIKNCIDILWTREQLSLRSATGAACPNIQNSEARPACSPQKIAYLQTLLNSRMDKEKSEISDAERTKRKKKTIEYLRSKIKTVRRDVTNLFSHIFKGGD